MLSSPARCLWLRLVASMLIICLSGIITNSQGTKCPGSYGHMCLGANTGKRSSAGGRSTQTAKHSLLRTIFKRLGTEKVTEKREQLNTYIEDALRKDIERERDYQFTAEQYDNYGEQPGRSDEPLGRSDGLRTLLNLAKQAGY